MKTPNTFLDALNTDLSDFVIKNTMLRLGMNMRLINLESSTYAITNIRGTEVAFNLTAGYTPLAAKQFDNVVYVLSINGTTCELGSFDSPDYTADSHGQAYYRPLNNLNSGPFRTTIFGYTLTSTVKMEIEPDYDASVNLILVEKDSLPRIVNTAIDRNATTGLLEVAPNRPSSASTNQYTTADVDEETRLILTSSLILKIALNSIGSGGNLKYGTYRYFFALMTEDFNPTEIIGQSGLCQVSSGDTKSSLRGGTSLQTTDRQVALDLTNIDQSFAYLKIYVLYSAGIDGLEQQMLEFNVPTKITGPSMTFYHTGYEEVTVVDQDVVNTTFQAIDSAGTAAQVNNYLILGRIKEDAIDFSAFQAAALDIATSYATKQIAYDSSVGALQGYEDPINTYDYLSLARAEAYPYRAIFILPSGRLTPPFPIKGKDYLSGGATNNNGIVRLPAFKNDIFYDGANVTAYGITFDLSSVPSPIKTSSIGFFIVRAERVPNALANGYLFPTLMVRPNQDSLSDNDSSYYLYQAGTESTYKLIPCIDNLLEAYDHFNSGSTQAQVVDNTKSNIVKDGYMPIFIQHVGSASSPPGGGAPNQPVTGSANNINNYPENKYAFVSGDDIANEPSLIQSIAQRTGMQCVQNAMGNMLATSNGQSTPIWTGAAESSGVSTSMFYDMVSFYIYSSPVTRTIDDCEFVPAESYATGSQFASRVAMHFKNSTPGGGHTGNWYDVAQAFNSYFGMSITNLQNDDYGATYPRAGNQRLALGKYNANYDTAGIAYNNLNTIVPTGFYVSIYPSGGQNIALSSLYPDTDSLIYKQVGPRFLWADVAGGSCTIFDGDTYICKFYRKMYQSGYRDPVSPLDPKNINSGMLVSMWQESIYNLALRNPNRYDASELVDRSFYPFQSGQNFYNYQLYRYPETQQVSRGYSPGLGPKSYIPVSSLIPFIKTDFFTRLSVSAQHIPNAFTNGYRFFGIDKFKDYDPSMGRLIDIQAFRDQLVMIFEHGVGAASINARVLTGRDPSGPIYAQPSDVLPATIGYHSRQLGAQSLTAVIATPSAIYGLDIDKNKIWQLRDGMKAISDEAVSSFLTLNPPVNPRLGYDFQYNEVIFATDNWTLCFREGLEKFTSLYSFTPTFFTSRGKDFFSFFPQASVQNFHKHNSASNKSIYGTVQDCFIEFTVNADESITKVFDVLEIFSNEVNPKLVEFFVMDDSSRNLTITPANCIQYSHVDNTVDFFRNVPNYVFRDKRFIVQVPKAENYNSGLDKNIVFGWDIQSRMRNKYLTVRLTYNTTQALQLMSVLTTFRASKS